MMKQITFDEFKRLITPLVEYNKEYDEVNEAIKVLCKHPHSIISLGAFLHGEYVNLLSLYLEVDEELMSELIYEPEKLTDKVIKNIFKILNEEGNNGNLN